MIDVFTFFTHTIGAPAPHVSQQYSQNVRIVEKVIAHKAPTAAEQRHFHDDVTRFLKSLSLVK